MGKVIPQNKWEAKIEWLDKNHYLKLNETDKKKLLRFRSLHSYINKLSKSIDEREEKIQMLKSEISEKEKGRKKYLNEGKFLYQFLEKLKSDLKITVYYTEGKTTKILKKDKYKTIATEKKVYSQCLLRFKTANNKKIYSINLAPKRIDILNDIKKVDPKWFNEIGNKLIKGENVDINRVKSALCNYYKPIIEKLFKKNYQKILDGKYSLTKDMIYKELVKLNK